MEDNLINLVALMTVVFSVVVAVVVYLNTRSVNKAVEEFTKTTEKVADNLYNSTPVFGDAVDFVKPIFGTIDDQVSDDTELGQAIATFRRFLDQIDGNPNLPQAVKEAAKVVAEVPVVKG